MQSVETYFSYFAVIGLAAASVTDFCFTDYIPVRTSEVVSICSYRRFLYTYQGHRGNIPRKIKIILGGLVVVSLSRSCFPHGGWH